MLLRSSSNPVLESLLSPLSCHTELWPEHVKAECAGSESVVAKSLSLTCRGCGSSAVVVANLHSNLDPHSQLATNAGCSPFARMRKVLSDSDLCSRSAGSSESPVLVAASCFVQDDKSDSCDSVVRSHHLHCQKDRTSLPLNRWRSLGSFPSDLPTVLSSGSAILEEMESASAILSATSEEGEDKEGDLRVFVKLASSVGSAPSIVAEEGATDVGKDDGHGGNKEKFELGIAKDERSGRDMLPESLGGGHAGAEANSSQSTSDAFSSGWQEPAYMTGNCLTRFAGGREAVAGTAVLDAQVLGESSQTRYTHHREAWEVATHGAGDGGRGVRPPTSAGGGGGWSGGYGGSKSDPTELHYQSVLKENPGNALILQNYAQYLAEVKRDYRKSEEFFQRAILANPTDGELLSNYAKMLWEGQKDRERAASYFERAVQAAPDNSYVMAAYASFLWTAEEEEEEEEQGPEEMNGSSPDDLPGGLFSLVSASLA